jgi:hypothetical protein
MTGGWCRRRWVESATKAGQWLQTYDGFGNLTKRWMTLPGQAPVVEADYPVDGATNRRTGPEDPPQAWTPGVDACPTGYRNSTGRAIFTASWASSSTRTGSGTG